ncbi:hypothetical protein [Shimia sp. Alg240-R146]|nr:hypothetical protein [Shimia sp. Alg240-R146]
MDGTREVLQGYAGAGVVHVIDEPGRDFSQSHWVTNAARIARER